MAGTFGDFWPGVDLMFHTSGTAATGATRLNVVVLVRRAPSHSVRRANLAHLQVAPPAGATSGGGSSIGPFVVQIYWPIRELWVDGVLFLTLPADHNLVLLVERNDVLEIFGTDRVRDEFGLEPRPLGTDLSGWLAHLRERLRDELGRCAQVRAFLSG
jgi:hypothetical protein